ncbi:MAG TPA: helicase HerA-like domain-containing protein [Spongiibacteraceae bacterium]|nr:helicase HerA-like domain-containing protein [Spongiibacteraceae bacterium]
MDNNFLIGANSTKRVALTLRMANRHGLITGATGTGKTVTLQVLAENFSRNGVPVFMADVKGDLSGIARAGTPNEKIQKRVQQLALDNYQNAAYPTQLWDLYGKRGLPIRATVSSIGPLLLSQLLELNDTQVGVLYAAFKIADANGLLLLDMKDLRALLTWIADNAKTLQSQYGNLAPASIAAIQRQLLVLEEQGADAFLGEPQIALADLMQTDFSGNGVVSIFDAAALMTKPHLYAMFLLWLLSELFEELPEAGDLDKPKLVFFFDEAHLLFNDAPKALIEKIEQVVRLIRSKAVGVYFITQNPLDVPETILGQLGNRVQHALRAFSPKDQKAVRAAAQTFRANPDLDTETAITELGVGEALVSVLDEKGQPTPVERVFICPPQSRIGPLSDSERSDQMQRSPLRSKYEQALDRESAYETLAARAQQMQTESAVTEAKNTRAEPNPTAELLGAFAKSAARSIGTQVGREIIRGVLGSLLGGSKRR